jgi:hypothetical protein
VPRSPLAPAIPSSRVSGPSVRGSEEPGAGTAGFADTDTAGGVEPRCLRGGRSLSTPSGMAGQETDAWGAEGILGPGGVESSG